MIVSLVLHAVVPGLPVKRTDVPVETLRAILEAARELDIRTSTVSSPGREFGIDLRLTFDDGSLSDFEVVFPLLQRYQARATFFLATQWVGMPGRISWDHAREMAAAGMEIGSHGVTHQHMPGLDDEVLADELRESKHAIERELGSRVGAFAYPFGERNRRTDAAAWNAGYRTLCTSFPWVLDHPAAKLPRISVRNLVSAEDARSLLQPSKVTLAGRAASYGARRALRRLIGRKSYTQLRDRISGRLDSFRIR